MSMTPYEYMQQAVDIVNNSEHPQNKIAALLSGMTPDGGPFNIAYTNFWPSVIVDKLGTDTRIGNASGTIHAETACIINAPRTEGSEVYITDPFCPNCAKNMAEAGVQTIYIDHKGFEKDFVNRRREYFETMSLRICEKAGINVFKIWRKNQNMEALLKLPENFRPPKHETISQHKIFTSFDEFVLKQTDVMEGKPFAAGIGTDITTKTNLALVAETRQIKGFPEHDQEMKNIAGKYNYIIEPTTRLIIGAARNGIRIDPGNIFSSRVPTAREQVNLIGIGAKRILTGNKTSARDQDSINAMRTLEENGILKFEELKTDII